MTELISSLGNSIVAIVFILGSCIFVHEFGHFLMAKLAGMRVEELMIGFPPRLFSVVRGETRYGVGLVPFGGFCRIAGMEPGQENVERGFYTRPRYWQALVIAAGVLMNVVLAIGLFTLLGVVWGVVAGEIRPPKIDRLIMGDTPARRAGLRPGDTIVALDGERCSLEIAHVRKGSIGERLGLAKGDVIYRVGDTYVAVPGDVIREVTRSLGPVEIRVFPGASDVEAEPKVIRATARKLGMVGKQSRPLSLGETWGVSFAGLRLESVEIYISQRPNKLVHLTVERDGTEIEVPVTPRTRAVKVQEEDGSIVRREIGQIGIVFAAIRRHDVGHAVRTGLLASLSVLQQAGDVVRQLIRDRRVEVTGLVGAMYYAHREAQVGWEAVLDLCAKISLSLVVINLLPIPVVDGGRLVLIAYEAVVKRRVDARYEMTWLMAGVVFIILAFAATTVKDVWNLLVYQTP